nr:hypothetical protein CFP56_30009 [Quercus suber]
MPRNSTQVAFDTFPFANVSMRCFGTGQTLVQTDSGTDRRCISADDASNELIGRLQGRRMIVAVVRSLTVTGKDRDVPSLSSWPHIVDTARTVQHAKSPSETSGNGARCDYHVAAHKIVVQPVCSSLLSRSCKNRLIDAENLSGCELPSNLIVELQANMGPETPLPHSPFFADSNSYVDSLLDFVSNDSLLRSLCGGVHVLDFFTCDPDLYSQILPQEWRDFFSEHGIMDLLDLMMREDLTQFTRDYALSETQKTWRNGPTPPHDLVHYLTNVTRHILLRKPAGSQCSRNRALKPTQKLARHVSVGMNVKKVHEVGLFAQYLDQLTEDVATSPVENGERGPVTHLVDFGSGQNYLGRALASEPYNKRIVAIESKSHNAERAREFDVMAKLSEKKKILRNKKTYRAALEGLDLSKDPPTRPSEDTQINGLPGSENVPAVLEHGSIEVPPTGHGRIQYIDHSIASGDLSSVIPRIQSSSAQPNLLVMSLHSCGNLVHHGLRSLLLNPQVRAVAMVGCCYNLLTERLGPATYKLPSLRPTTAHPRLVREANAKDPHGFPMSARLCSAPESLHLNITARMMAVQAPQNWGARDSAAFFTRHFYRALLQRIFLDRGVVGPPKPAHLAAAGGGSPAGHSSGGTPIVIGSLRKACYEDFSTYVRGALEKLTAEGMESRQMFLEKMGGITEGEIRGYEERYARRKKELSVVWSLMAVSAGVVEAVIVVDRYLWLTEQTEMVAKAWVEPVFEYSFSPRNLVVVGIKK